MPVTLYPPVITQNLLSPDHGGYYVDELCQQIYDATKGWGVSSIFLCKIDMFVGGYAQKEVVPLINALRLRCFPEIKLQ